MLEQTTAIKKTPFPEDDELDNTGYNTNAKLLPDKEEHLEAADVGGHGI